MRVRRIGEVVHLHVVLDALLDEAERVLPHDGAVHGALADQELALQVLRLVDEARFRKTLRVRCLRVHVAFAVHDLVPLPIDDRAAGDGHLEHVGIVGDEADGHETAVAPAVDADAVLVHVRELHQAAEARHLVGHLGLAALAVDGALEFRALVGGATVVLDIDEIALLGHEHLPHPHAAQPAVLHHLGVRTAIDVHDHRILLRRVEILRIVEAVVVVELPVGARDGAQLHGAGGEVLERVARLEELLRGLAVRAPEQRHARGVQVRVAVEEPGAGAVHGHVVPAALRREGRRLADFRLLDGLLRRRLDTHLVEMVLDGGDFGGGVEHVHAVVAHVLDIGIDGRQTADVAQGVKQIEVAEAVAEVRPVDHQVLAALEEPDRVQRLHPAFVILRQERADELARRGAVLVQLHVVLGAVQDLHIDGLVVRGPADVREEALRGELRGVQVHGAALVQVVDAQGHDFRVHPVHRVLDELQLAGAGADVQEREVRHAGFVLAVEGELPARRGPEDAAIDAELVPAHGLPVDDLAVVGDGHGDGVLAVGDVQAVAHVEGSPAHRRLRRLKVLVDARGHPLPAFLEAVFVVIDPGVIPVLRGQAADDGVFHRQHPAVMRRMRADHARLGKKNAAHEGGAQQEDALFHKNTCSAEDSMGSRLAGSVTGSLLSMVSTMARS